MNLHYTNTLMDFINPETLRGASPPDIYGHSTHLYYHQIFTKYIHNCSETTMIYMMPITPLPLASQIAPPVKNPSLDGSAPEPWQQSSLQGAMGGEKTQLGFFYSILFSCLTTPKTPRHLEQKNPHYITQSFSHRHVLSIPLIQLPL